MKKRTIIAMLPLVAFAALTACGKIPHSPAPDKIDPYYLIGSREDRENLSALFTLLAKEDNTPEGTFAVVREIANSFARAKEYGRLIHFLGGRTINFPDDPYNSYYLLMIAYIYMQQDALPIAAQNFDLIVKNYPDLTVNGESIHYACLNQLINLSKYPIQRVWYYQELISRFSDRIDLGTAWFMLAQTYEQIGDWNSAIQAYTSYLKLPSAGVMIPGFPNADSYARQQVMFNNSRKDWTFESLPSLITAVKAALDAGSSWQLGRCQAKVISLPVPGGRVTLKTSMCLFLTCPNLCMAIVYVMRMSLTLLPILPKPSCGQWAGISIFLPGISTSGKSIFPPIRRFTAAGNGPGFIMGRNFR